MEETLECFVDEEITANIFNCYIMNVFVTIGHKYLEGLPQCGGMAFNVHCHSNGMTRRI
jgi:hypothetical protein